LSEYLKDNAALSCAFMLAGFNATIQDNFLSVASDGVTPQQALDLALENIEKFIQSLSVLFNQRFASRVLSVDDELGNPQQVNLKPQQVKLMSLTLYDLNQLQSKIRQAANWVDNADPLVTKSLFYFENACLLNEFAQALPFFGTHAAQSRSLAFLQ
jgi:hypothetical protein